MLIPTYLLIIRHYRKYHKTKPNQINPNQVDSVKEDGDDSSGSDSDDNNKRRKSEYRKPWRESTVTAPVIDSDVKIGKIYYLLREILGKTSFSNSGLLLTLSQKQL